MRRRKLIELVVAGTGTALVAGCAGDDEEGGDSTDGSGGSDSSEDAGEESEDDNGDDESDDEPDDVDPEAALEDESVDSTRDGLELLEHDFYAAEFEAGVEGVVVNETGGQLDYVEVTVVFYNAEGQRIDDSIANTTDLPDGEEWLFDVPLIGSEPEDVDDYDVAVADSPF